LHECCQPNPALADENTMRNEKWLTTSVVVIAGASADVGEEVARRFALVGAKLGLISWDRQSVEALASELRGVATAVATATVDVSDARALDAAAEVFERELGPIAIWVNDATPTVLSPVSEMSPEEFRRITEVSYLGVTFGCMAALKRMRSRNRGQIMNVSSIWSYQSIPLQSAHCGAEHAVRGFTASLRSELRHENSGICLSLVVVPATNRRLFDRPGTQTELRPGTVGKACHPEAAAAAVLRAARTRAREYHVGASTQLTMICNMIAPALLQRYFGWLGYRLRRGGRTRRDNPITSTSPPHRVGDTAASRNTIVVSGSVLRGALFLTLAVVFLALGAVML
jgi:short-subunit dehydrogenase